MSIFDCIQEIIFAYSLCSNEHKCATCIHKQACCEVFEKTFTPCTAIEEFAAQCKAFNEFARANKKGN